MILSTYALDEFIIFMIEVTCSYRDLAFSLATCLILTKKVGPPNTHLTIIAKIVVARGTELITTAPTTVLLHDPEVHFN